MNFLLTGGSSWGRGHKLDTFDAYMEYAGDNAVSNNAGRAKESSSLATDGVRATLADLFSRHGLSGAAGILRKPQTKDSGTVPAPQQSRTPLHMGYSGDVKSEPKPTDAAPEGLPIATTYNTMEPRVDIGDGSNPGDNVAHSPLTSAERGGYPPVIVTGMFPRGHGRGWVPPRHPLLPNPPNMHPNVPPHVVESVPPIYTCPPPPIQHRPMNPWVGGRGGGKYKPWNAQGHSTNR